MLSRFSKPVEDRAIYRLIRKNQVQSIVEVGLGDGKRLERMLRTAFTFCDPKNLRYTGIDLFDARPESPLKLIEMHKATRAIPAKTQLVPGDLRSAIKRIANSHLRTDLVVVAAGYEAEQLGDVLAYLPRMLHASSKLLLQEQPGEAFQPLSRLEVERMAAAQENRIAQKAA